MSSFPTALDAPAGTAAQGTTLLTSIDHAADHRTLGSAVVAVETFLGTNAGTNVFGAFTAGQQVLPIKSGTLGTIITNGTINLAGQGTNSGTMANGVYGTATIQGGTLNSPTIVVGSDATGDIYYRSSGGTLTRLGAGTAGQFLKTNGTTPSWANALTLQAQYFTPMLGFQNNNYVAATAYDGQYITQFTAANGTAYSFSFFYIPTQGYNSGSIVLHVTMTEQDNTNTVNQHYQINDITGNTTIVSSTAYTWSSAGTIDYAIPAGSVIIGHLYRFILQQDTAGSSGRVNIVSAIGTYNGYF